MRPIILIMILALWFSHTALLSAESKHAATSYRWDDRVSTYEAYWDDPRPLLAEAKRLLATLDPEREPLRWLQIFCSYGMSNDVIHEMPGLDQHLRTAKRIAKALGRWDYEIDIGIIEGAYVESLTSDSPPDVLAEYGRDIAAPYERALRIAEEHNSLRDFYLVGRNYMNHLRNHGQTSRIMKLFENASQHMQEGSGLQLIDRLQLKKNMIFIYRLIGQDEGLRRHTKELADECQRRSYRSFCAYVLYEYGYMLSMSNGFTDYPRAYPILFRAESLAKDLDDHAILSVIDLMIAQLSYKLDKPEEAIRFAERAEAHARAVGAFATLGLAIITRADSLRKLKRYDEAIALLERLKKDMPRSQLELQSNLHKLLADIHSEMGFWKPALEARDRQISFQQKYLAERSKENFTKQTAKLGLQLEQEKNKALRSENELQQQQLQHADYERKTIIFSTLGVIIIAIASLLALVWVSRKNREINKLHRFIETQVLQRFLPPQVVGDILAGKSHFEQKAQHRIVTVLFADLVNFTESAERMEPQDLTELLNRFFAEMSDVVFEHGGVIDKFIGDAIMVVFGAPPQELTPELQAEYSTNCALHLLECLGNLNEGWRERFGITFSMRVGIHQGPGVVGTFGSNRRSDYTVIGHTVNLASRIEGKALPDQILISESVAAHLPADRTADAGSFRLKGIEHPVALFALNIPVELRNVKPEDVAV